MDWKTLASTALPNPITDRIIILDLDETLIHTINDDNQLMQLNIYNNMDMIKFLHHGTFPVCYSVNAEDGISMGLTRPHLKEFLTFIHNYFAHVLVWSAGTFNYVSQIVYYVFEKNGFPPPATIWSRDNCFKMDPAGDQFSKPINNILLYLADIWKLPIQDLEKKCIIVDDRKDNFVYNPNNGILIPPWCPVKKKITLAQLKNRSDNNLIKIMTWLCSSEVLQAPDLRPLNKSIF